MKGTATGRGMSGSKLGRDLRPGDYVEDESEPFVITAVYDKVTFDAPQAILCRIRSAVSGDVECLVLDGAREYEIGEEIPADFAAVHEQARRELLRKAQKWQKWQRGLAAVAEIRKEFYDLAPPDVQVALDVLATLKVPDDDA